MFEAAKKGKKKANIDLAKRAKWITRFYNKISGNDAQSINEIPIDQLIFITSISYDSIVTPFLLEDNLKGKGRPHLQEKYDISEFIARRILS